MPTATVTTITLPARPAPFAVVRSDDGATWTFQPLYAAGAGAPLGRLQTVTTAAKHPDALLDACLAFFPEVFAGCAALALVQQVVGEAEQLDLSGRLPVGWAALRGEGKAVMMGAAVKTAQVEVG